MLAFFYLSRMEGIAAHPNQPQSLPQGKSNHVRGVCFLTLFQSQDWKWPENELGERRNTLWRPRLRLMCGGNCRIEAWCKSDRLLSVMEAFLREKKNVIELTRNAPAGSVSRSKSLKLSASKPLAIRGRMWGNAGETAHAKKIGAKVGSSPILDGRKQFWPCPIPISCPISKTTRYSSEMNLTVLLQVLLLEHNTRPAGTFTRIVYQRFSSRRRFHHR